jgi:hypothetical protein
MCNLNCYCNIVIFYCIVEFPSIRQELNQIWIQLSKWYSTTKDMLAIFFDRGLRIRSCLLATFVKDQVCLFYLINEKLIFIILIKILVLRYFQLIIESTQGCSHKQLTSPQRTIFVQKISTSEFIWALNMI